MPSMRTYLSQHWCHHLLALVGLLLLHLLQKERESINSRPTNNLHLITNHSLVPCKAQSYWVPDTPAQTAAPPSLWWWVAGGRISSEWSWWAGTGQVSTAQPPSQEHPPTSEGCPSAGREHLRSVQSRRVCVRGYSGLVCQSARDRVTYIQDATCCHFQYDATQGPHICPLIVTMATVKENFRGCKTFIGKIML